MPLPWEDHSLLEKKMHEHCRWDYDDNHKDFGGIPKHQWK